MELEKLNNYIRDRHYPINALSDDLNITRQSMYMKLTGERDFKASEMVILAKVLRMTNDEILDIFFNK